MFNDAIRMIFEEWKLCVSYLLIFILIRSIALKSDYLFFITVIELYVFYSFLYAFRSDMESNNVSNFLRSLIVVDKKNLFNYLVLIIFIFFVYYIISIPIALLEFIKNGDLVNFFGSGNFTILNVFFETVFKTLYQIVLCFSVAHLIYFEADVLESMFKGLKSISKVKELVLFLIVLNFVINMSGMMGHNIGTIFFNEFIWPLIFPFCVIVLFVELRRKQF